MLPFLNTGDILASFHSVINLPEDSDRLNSSQTEEWISVAHSTRIRAGRPPGPVDLLVFRRLSSSKTSPGEKVMLLRIAADSEQGLRVPRLEDKEQHEWSVKMEQKNEEKASALSRSVEKAALSSVNIVSGREEDFDLDLKF